MKLATLMILITLTPTRLAKHAYYFPVFVDRQPIGVAWYATPNSPDHAQQLGAYYFYNASSYASDKPQAIPIARPAYYQDIIATLDHGYHGYMLVGNEGEGENQDNLTHQQMATFIMTIDRLYPLAYLVCLNSYDLNYMLAVIDLIPVGTCESYGVHVTHLIGDQAVPDWLDTLCLDCEVWVTEIGWDNNDPQVYDRLLGLVVGAKLDNRVRFIFAYTTTDAHVESVNMIGQGGRLMPNGHAFRDGIKYE